LFLVALPLVVRGCRRGCRCERCCFGSVGCLGCRDGRGDFCVCFCVPFCRGDLCGCLPRGSTVRGILVDLLNLTRLLLSGEASFLPLLLLRLRLLLRLLLLAGLFFFFCVLLEPPPLADRPVLLLAVFLFDEVSLDGDASPLPFKADRLDFKVLMVFNFCNVCRLFRFFLPLPAPPALPAAPSPFFAFARFAFFFSAANITINFSNGVPSVVTNAFCKQIICARLSICAKQLNMVASNFTKESLPAIGTRDDRTEGVDNTNTLFNSLMVSGLKRCAAFDVPLLTSTNNSRTNQSDFKARCWFFCKRSHKIPNTMD